MNIINEIDRDSVIYIIGRAKQVTGGDELLHQLAHHLRVDLGHNVYIIYYPLDIENPVPPEYLEYNNPYTREVIDDYKNIIICSEWARDLMIIKQFTKMRKIIYWLSVNNFVFSCLLHNPFLSLKKSLQLLPARLVNKLLKNLLGKNLIDIRELLFNSIRDRSYIMHALQKFGIYGAALHLCQSWYAMEFLNSLGIENCVYLSDYLNPTFLQQRIDFAKKEDIVVYNPKKGWSFTRKIIQAVPHIRFVPIENLDRNGVIELLKRAKIYIDFGDHPGKDRLPREAAILGCCVIVGRRGSACNRYDVPIPEKYKFAVAKDNIPQIASMLEYCLYYYKECYSDFDYYRAIIKREPSVFLELLSLYFPRR